MIKKVHIFIGHTDPSFIEKVKPLLERSYTVSASSNGGEILNSVLELQPDIAVLDFTIPEIDVLKLCEQLTGGTSEINAVIYVSLEQLSLAKKKWRQRAFDYIIGHSDPQEFFEDVNKIVRYILIERERERLIRTKIELRYHLNNSLTQLKERIHEASESKDWGQMSVLTQGILDLENAIKESEYFV
ncbi:MAG: response regulator [Candidatus Omnitrophica bacterium]|nr:response regulator [Candidatus Omnitrophota bacterium]